MAQVNRKALPSSDVPIFLRKTYHMVDTCDPSICGWSDDGATFTVKDPEKFEKTIIPQFFKHSKFSSFVRQLNFYSFRKIKDDALRIDIEEEKKTAQYWRFRHDKFQRGKPELLLEMKRMAGKTNILTSKQAATPAKTVVRADRSEVQSLKKRIEEMTKDIDQLTQMIEKVSVKQDEIDKEPKRSKYDIESLPMPIPILSSMDPPVEPDLPLSDVDMDELDSLPLPARVPFFSRQDSSMSDSEFVDQLFTAFNEEDFLEESTLPDNNTSNNNRPDPKLMKRLSDALELLPKSIQELIVDRLISSITSGIDAVVKEATNGGKALPTTADDARIAPATLAALVNLYSDKKLKTIPVIPVHA